MTFARKTFGLLAVVLLSACQSADAGLTDSPWLEASSFLAEAGPDARVTLGPPGCPVVVIDRQVWHVNSQRVVQTLPDTSSLSEIRCLSANGMYLATLEGAEPARGIGVNVWNNVTGERAAYLPGDPRREHSVLKIMLNRYLIAAGKDDGTFTVWDIENNKQLRQMPTRASGILRGQFTVSADGKFLALVEGDRVSIISLADGRHAGNLPPPLRSTTNAGTPIPLPVNTMADLEFSPDNTELAAVFRTGEKQRLVVWDGKGRITADIALPIYGEHLNHFSLTWLPDQFGWVVDGNVIDRETQKIVVQIHRDVYDREPIGVLDPYFLIGRFGQAADAVSIMMIPWEQIERSLTAMKTAEDAIIGPDTQVSVYVYMGGKSGESIEDARRQIGDSLLARLREDGMSYAADQEAIFRFRILPAASGRAEGSLKLDLVMKGQETPIWEHYFNPAAARPFLQGIGVGQLNESAVEQAVREINHIQVPYFIPRTTDYMPLPLVVN